MRSEEIPPGLIYFVALLAGDVEQTRKKDGKGAGKWGRIEMRGEVLAGHFCCRITTVGTALLSSWQKGVVLISQFLELHEH